MINEYVVKSSLDLRPEVRACPLEDFMSRLHEDAMVMFDRDVAERLPPDMDRSELCGAIWSVPGTGVVWVWDGSRARFRWEFGNINEGVPGIGWHWAGSTDSMYTRDGDREPHL